MDKNCKLHNKQQYPSAFKVLTPPRETKKLDSLYDILFDVLHASWLGRSGHYAYDDENRQALKQDGYIYCFMYNGCFKITAASDCFLVNPSFIEIKTSELECTCEGDDSE